MSGGIFVSYRKNHNGVRRPHALAVAAIADRLRHHFGEDKVLIDMDLEAGDHYPSKLRGWLRDCEVMLVVVHREWLDDLKARRGEQWDWARWEVETALDMGLHVLPVLLDDAALPGKEKLREEKFPDLAEIATRQYWRLGFAGWQKDLAELLRMLEVRVATDDPPRAERQDPVLSKRFWGVLAVSAVLGLATPWPLSRLVGEDMQPPLVFLSALAIAVAVMLVVPLGITGLYYLARRWLDSQEKKLVEITHEARSNVIIGLTIVGIGVIVLFASRILSADAIVPAMAVLTLIIILSGHQWLHNRHGDPWPYPRLDPSPVSVRGALAHVGRFLARRDLLTRAEREQVEFVLGQAEWALARMDEDSKLGRGARFRRLKLLPAAVHLFILAMVFGSAAFAVAEGAAPYYGPYLAGTVVAAVLCYLAALDLAFRHRRWRLRVMVQSTPEDVERLRAKLAEISIPPATAQETAA